MKDTVVKMSKKESRKDLKKKR